MKGWAKYLNISLYNMSLYENEQCPVCKKFFTKEDDIVICHLCGTPHHRECYNSLGHCINSDKHNSNFEYVANAPDKPVFNGNTSKYNLNNEYYQTEQENSDNTCFNCGASLEDGEQICNHCSAKQQNFPNKESNPFVGAGYSQQDIAYKNSTKKIEDKSVSDISCVIKTNIPYFVSKFQKNKKISWNWCGFFFGPMYLFFRKMYAQGAAFIAGFLAISYVVEGVFIEKIKNYVDFYTANFNDYNQVREILANPKSEMAVKLTELANELYPVIIILFAAMLIINIIIAMFVNRIYRKKVLSIVERVDKNLGDGASFASTLPMMENEKLSQKDMKKLYLERMGGTSIFLPAMMLVSALIIYLF